MNVIRILYSAALVSAVASAALGADLYFTYQSMEEYSPPSAMRGKTSIGVPAKSAKKIDYSVIARRNLFSSIPLGKSAARQRALKSKSRKLARSRVLSGKSKAAKAVAPPLKLKLVGTTIGPEGIRFAIFEEGGGSKQSVYRVGTKVGGALIQKVNRGEVSLLYQGKVQVFRAFVGDGKKTSGGKFRATRPPLTGTAPPSPKVSGTPNGFTLKRVLRREQIARLIQSVEDLEKQFRSDTFQSAQEGEAGVRVFPIGRGRFLQLLGMRGGDIVREVNGSPVEEKAGLGTALMELVGRDEGEVLITRRGRRINISYRIQ